MQSEKQRTEHGNPGASYGMTACEMESADRGRADEKGKGPVKTNIDEKNNSNAAQKQESQVKMSFEDIFRQNERRIHYHIHRLNIQDPHREFYVEGLHAMWTAYKKYRPDQGVLSTYFNFTIRNRLIDMLRKKTRESHNQEAYIQQEKPNLDNGNRDCRTNMPIPDRSGIEVEDKTIWENIHAILTANQWKWVEGHIIKEMPLKEIAEQEEVTVEAVKTWAKTAKKRLRNAGVKEWMT